MDKQFKINLPCVFVDEQAYQAELALITSSSTSDALFWGLTSADYSLPRIFVSMSMAPGAAVAGAKVTVRDRSGAEIFSGTSNDAGTLVMRQTPVMTSGLPWSITTTGGTENGIAFTGQLQTLAWPAVVGTSHVHLNIDTSAAVLLVGKGPSPSKRVWRQKLSSVWAALKIPTDRVTDILRVTNNYVGYAQVKTASDADSAQELPSYNALVKDLAGAAKSNRSFNVLTPPVGQRADGGRSVPQARSSSSNSTVCSVPIPNATDSSSSPSLITNVAEILMSSLLEVAGAPGAVSGGIPGMLLSLVGVDGSSPLTSEISSVLTELNCISSQINALYVEAATSALVTAMKTANSCYSEHIQTEWLTYQDLVSASMPLSISKISSGVSGTTTLILPGTQYDDIYKGDTVSGTGIGILSLKRTASSVAGDYSVLIQGISTDITVGMTVTGTGVGVNSDGSPTTVTAVTPVEGNTTIAITSKITSAISGTLTFSMPATVATNPVENTNGDTVITLTAANSGQVTGPVTFTKLLNQANSSLMADVANWETLSDTCGANINDDLFTVQTEGTLTGWQQMVKNIYTNNGANTTPPFITQFQGQQLQQFISQWGTYQYMQFVLQNEAYNFNNQMTNAQALAGTDETNTDYCQEGSIATTPSNCVWSSNMTQAFVPTLYSDEIGLVTAAGDSMAVNSIPVGMVDSWPALSDTSSEHYPKCDNGDALPLGQDAFSPSWFECQMTHEPALDCNLWGYDCGPDPSWCNYQACWDVHWKIYEIQDAVMDIANGYPLNSNVNTAFESWGSPAVYHPIKPTNDSVSALSDTTALQALLNGINQQPSSKWASFTTTDVGFYAADAEPFYYINVNQAEFGCGGCGSDYYYEVKFETVIGESTYKKYTSSESTGPHLAQIMGRTWWTGASGATAFMPSDPPAAP